MSYHSTHAKRGIFSALAAVVLLIGWVASPAGASLIGDDVTLQVTAANFGPTTAVGNTSSAEWTIVSSFDAILTADILDDDTIRISLIPGSNSTAGGVAVNSTDYLFTDLDWGGAGTVSGIGLTSMVGFATFSSITLQSNTSVLVSGLTLVINAPSRPPSGPIASLTFDLIPAHATNNAVPEPLTVSLGLMGLGVLGIATRRRAA